jgi:tetratricopeptide (TPR) repeat protein
MKSNFYLIILAFATLLNACSSGKRQLQRGDYDEAVMASIKRLKQSPENKKANDIFPKAYKFAKQKHLNAIEIEKNSSNPLKWDAIVSHYKTLNSFYYNINDCPACLIHIPIPNFYQNEDEYAKLEAAKYHYSEGIRLMAIKDIMASRDAYGHFVKTKYFLSNYENVDDWIFKSRDAGTLNVLIKAIPMHSRTLALSNEFFSNKIIEYAKGLNYNFVHFFSDYDNVIAKYDQIVYIKFDDFIVGQSIIKETVEEFTIDSVKIGDVDTKEGKKAVYGTVKAKLHTFTKTVVSNGLLDFQIVNASNGAIIKHHKFPGSYNWYTNWGYFNGDERALTKEQLIITTYKELPPPLPQDLFINFTVPIYDQVTNTMRNYFAIHR